MSFYFPSIGGTRFYIPSGGDVKTLKEMLWNDHDVAFFWEAAQPQVLCKYGLAKTQERGEVTYQEFDGVILPVSACTFTDCPPYFAKSVAGDYVASSFMVFHISDAYVLGADGLSFYESSGGGKQGLYLASVSGIASTGVWTEANTGATVYSGDFDHSAGWFSVYSEAVGNDTQTVVSLYQNGNMLATSTKVNPGLFTASVGAQGFDNNPGIQCALFARMTKTLTTEEQQALFDKFKEENGLV